jgi:hypothetical protein
MTPRGQVWLLGLALLLVLAPLALADEAFLWDGNQWPQLSFDAKVGYVKGIGNLADFETAAAKGRFACVSRAFADELKTKTVNQIILEVDKFYQQNPDKLKTSVIEVILRRCTSVCPPELEGGEKKK